MENFEQPHRPEDNPETPFAGETHQTPINEFLDNHPEFQKIYNERATVDKIVFNESGRIVSDGQTYDDNPRIRAFVELGNAVRKSLSNVQEGYVRLWRGNRPGEVGHNPSYTNSLEGIALPFLRGYKGVLSYIDVPQEALQKYVRTSGAATDAEFILPAEVVKDAKIIGFTPEEADEMMNKARPLSETGSIDTPDSGWSKV